MSNVTLLIAKSEIQIAQNHLKNEKNRNTGYTLFPVFMYRLLKLDQQTTGIFTDHQFQINNLPFEITTLPYASYSFSNIKGNDVVIKRSNIFELIQTLSDHGLVGIMADLDGMKLTYPLARRIYLIDDYGITDFTDKDCIWTTFAEEFSRDVDRFGNARYKKLMQKRLNQSPNIVLDAITDIKKKIDVVTCAGVRDTYRYLRSLI